MFVGTTGRVLDHLNRGNINFSSIRTVILDEADQMLKLGFKEDVEKVIFNVSLLIDNEDNEILVFKRYLSLLVFCYITSMDQRSCLIVFEEELQASRLSLKSQEQNCLIGQTSSFVDIIWW